MCGGQQECIWLVGWWKGSCLECARERKPCTSDGKVLVLCFPEEYQGKGPSKCQKTAELSLTKEALVLDALVALTDEVIQLRKVVMQQGKLIISSLVDGKKELMGEVGGL